eukprot:scaffold135404_cov30-Cyclotella_meneghiniana.AAC.1
MNGALRASSFAISFQGRADFDFCLILVLHCPGHWSLMTWNALINPISIQKRRGENPGAEASSDLTPELTVDRR